MSAVVAGVRPVRRFNTRVALSAAFALAGLLLFGQGLYIHAKAMVAQMLLERAFSKAVATHQPQKPWPWLDTVPVARISVPRLGQSAIALEGASGQALAFGPGHVTGTPAAGEPGTAVYAAHRDTQFAFLGKLKPGDVIEVDRIDGAMLDFRVTDLNVVPWNASGIDPNAPGTTLALSTCWPIGAITPGPLRLVVRGVSVK